MIERCTIDTNILVYSVDPTDMKKHTIALRILSAMRDRAAAVPMQVLAEFYSATTRKKLLTHTAAAALVNDLMLALEVVHAEPPDLQAAIALRVRDNLQLFDALICCTAARVGCRTLITEDLQNQRALGGILITNPFKLNPADLATLLG